jgi:hypothetical protein
MPNNYRHPLDKSSKKFICPNCGKKSLTRYIDIETNQYLPQQYGRCDHENSCVPHYHLKPDQAPTSDFKPLPMAKPQQVYFMPETVLNSTLKDYHLNTFVQNLCKLAAVADVQKVIELYRLGTIGKGERIGAVCFPFIDIAGNVRTIQAKQFNEDNHTTTTDFVHSILSRGYLRQGKALPDWLNDYSKNDLKVSCLFGEHLLSRYPSNTIALVEAPKTAIIGALYYGLPEKSTDLIWLAVYNKSSLSVEKCKALQGRKVVLYPDLNAYNDWSTRTQELRAKIPGTNFVVSDLLEKNATQEETSKGLDLADYLTYLLFGKCNPDPKPITYVKMPLPTKEPGTRYDYFGTDEMLHVNYPY